MSRPTVLLQPVDRFKALQQKRPAGRFSFKSSAVALLEFLPVATRARVIAADILQGVAYRLLGLVVAMRAVHVAVVMVVIVIVVMTMVVIVVAVRSMDMRLLSHCRSLRN
jgi:hypothetical protein